MAYSSSTRTEKLWAATAASSPRELARQLALQSPRISCGLPPGWGWEARCWVPSAMAKAATTRKKRKVVVITFGGGARDQETFAHPRARKTSRT
jgi:hypothetical protein